MNDAVTAVGNPAGNAVALALLQSRAQAICDEMGVMLRRTAFSPNIKDRLDYSCALFDAGGELFAQAAHIPVHLGSMAFAMVDVVASIDWRPGDVVLFNDPFLGGTHLPDVTVVQPVFVDADCIGFAACRAHHADIGAAEPGSMPLSRTLEEEGVVIPPMLLRRDGLITEAAGALLAQLAHGGTAPVDAPGSEPGDALDVTDLQSWQGEPALADFFAQISSAGVGAQRLEALARGAGSTSFAAQAAALNDYAARLAADALALIPDGTWCAADVLDDDGWALAGDPDADGARGDAQGHAQGDTQAGSRDIRIEAAVRVTGGRIDVDFAGTSGQVAGNLNCPLSVAAAAVYYVFRCLMPAHTPGAAGAFRDIHISAPSGCLVNARRPAAVAAGNVETSMRIVDVLLQALAPALPQRIPACSQGTMNNVAMGRRASGVRPTGVRPPGVRPNDAADAAQGWDYYETLAGGLGAGPAGPGASALHSHMTNTLNTPVESLEGHYPLRVISYALRRGSGGQGLHAGGDGVERTYEFLAPARCTLLTERRRHGPPGLAGGAAGEPGRNALNGRELQGKCVLELAAGDRLTIATPGGGGWGALD